MPVTHSSATLSRKTQESQISPKSLPSALRLFNSAAEASFELYRSINIHKSRRNQTS